MDKHIHFYKEGVFDPYWFSELLFRAKGCRTMKEFAVECGTSPATFSRIAKMTNRGPSSPELLQAIAVNADPYSDVTLELLAEANGYVVAYESSPAEEEIPYNISLAQDVLVSNLLKSGNSVAVEKAEYQISHSTTASPDLLLVSNAPSFSYSRWFVKLFSSIDKDKFYGPMLYEERVAKMAMNWFSIFSFIAMLPISPKEKPTCYSLVVFGEKEYNIIRNEFGNTFVSEDISVIFLDPKDRCIYCSFTLPRASE